MMSKIFIIYKLSNHAIISIKVKMVRRIAHFSARWHLDMIYIRVF